MVEQRLRSCGSEFQMWCPKQEKVRKPGVLCLYCWIFSMWVCIYNFICITHMLKIPGQAASTGRRTGSCCCSCCRSAISVGEARGSGPLRLPQCWLCYTALVPPDSSSTLPAGASRHLLYIVSWLVVTLLLPILIAAPGL